MKKTENRGCERRSHPLLSNTAIKKRILLSAVFLALIAGCWRLSDNIMNEPDMVSTGAIFDAEYSLKLEKEGNPLGFQGPYWTPTRQQIAELEKILPQYVESNVPAHYSNLKTDLADYKRQYYGITRFGKKVVYVSAFCKEHWSRNDTWITGFVFAIDGGECFFQLTYDPEVKEILTFTVSGEA